MELTSLIAIFRALREAGVRYLVAGGLAVNAHGYQRLTVDADLVIELQPDNLRAAFAAFDSLGYRPSVPVTAEGFADPEQRKRWIRDKGMRVLNLVSDRYRETPVDLFVSEPFDFETEWNRALIAEVSPDLEVGFVSLRTLVEMKRAAGRPVDLDDVEHLRWIEEEQGADELD